MKSLMKVLVLVAGTTLLFLSCSKDDAIDFFIDAPLQSYFDRFAEEGALRNVVVDYEALKITGDIRIITSHQVIGQCVHTENEPNTVIIDKLYWDQASELDREFLVFHELGHCALNRGHTDAADGSGKCISIMTSGTGNCQINYTPTTRKLLLDELFMK